MAALASTRLDMCQTPQQTVEMNLSHFFFHVPLSHLLPAKEKDGYDQNCFPGPKEWHFRFSVVFTNLRIIPTSRIHSTYQDISAEPNQNY